MHEVITLQFGQQANYIGTHYWNTQESYFTYAGQDESPVDHGISFRAGIGANGEDTYSPRTLIYDLKGAFGTLRRENALYELQQQGKTTQQGGWSGATVPLQLPPIASSPYQQALDTGIEPPQLTTETVRFWSDYNHLFYHPRSIIQLNEYELNSSLMPFERWSTGEELFANLDREHDILDRDLRPWLEECDQLQGLQVFSGVDDDAWGGFAAKYLERVSDELGKGCRWVFGTTEGKREVRERQMLRIANTAQSLNALHGSASVQLPLTSLPPRVPSYLHLDSDSRWHISALQAAAIESVTLPTRLRGSCGGQASFGDLESVLDSEGNRRMSMTGLSVKAEDGASEPNGYHDTRMVNGHNGSSNIGDENNIELFTNTPSGSSRAASSRPPHIFSTISNLRGDWDDDDEDSNNNRRSEGPRISKHQTALAFPLLSSYPHIFNFDPQPQKLAVKASITTSTAVADYLRGLEGTARRLIGIDEREALCDGLMTMAEEYEEGWTDDEEYDDDA